MQYAPRVRLWTRAVTGSPTIVTLTAAILISGFIGACNDDDKGPEPGTSLSQYWPNADGLAWNYDLTSSLFDDPVFDPGELFVHPDSVPAVPSLTIAAALLDVELGPPFSSESGLFTLQFAGMDTTEFGAIGQNLVETLDGLPTHKAWPVAGAEVGHPERYAGAGAWPRYDALLRRLAAVRPDLRAGLGLEGQNASLAAVDPLPLFLSGGIWVKSSEWIGRYSALDTLGALEPEWFYLEADLDIGHEFTRQLLPTIVDDVFLHGRVHGHVTVENAAGRFEDALEVVYLLDAGVIEFTDESGATLGYTRFFDLARIVYVADVGPVHSDERVFYVFTKTGLLGPFAVLDLPLQSTVAP